MDESVVEFHKSAEDDHWWFVGRRAIIRGVLSRIAGDREHKILEIGCGTGGNINMLLDYGRVVGIEPNVEAHRYCQNRHPATTIRFSGWPDSELLAEGPTFSLVCMFDVLEHLDSPEEALRSILAVTADDAQLIITVPAYQWLWSPHDVLNHHYRRYSVKKLTGEIQNAGWTCAYVSHFNVFLFPIAIAQRVGQKITKSTPRDIPPPQMLNRLFKAIFKSEVRILHRLRMPFGLSIVVVCYKTQ